MAKVSNAIEIGCRKFEPPEYRAHERYRRQTDFAETVRINIHTCSLFDLAILLGKKERIHRIHRRQHGFTDHAHCSVQA